MNIDKIVSELDELHNGIIGFVIPKELELYANKKINKIKSLLGVEEEIKDNIVFVSSDKNADCKIIQTITGEFIFQIHMKEDDFIWDSAENGVELEDDGVYSTFDKCMNELKDTYKNLFDTEMKI